MTISFAARAEPKERSVLPQPAMTTPDTANVPAGALEALFASVGRLTGQKIQEVLPRVAGTSHLRSVRTGDPFHRSFAPFLFSFSDAKVLKIGITPQGQPEA
jgi:hypothetical protein